MRVWKFHECDNCKAMYLEKPPTSCDCSFGDQTFTERQLIDMREVFNIPVDSPVLCSSEQDNPNGRVSLKDVLGNGD